MAKMKTDLARQKLIEMPVGTQFKSERIKDREISSSSLYHFLIKMIKEGTVEKLGHGTFVKLKNPAPKKPRTRKAICKRKKTKKSITLKVVKTAICGLIFASPNPCNCQESSSKIIISLSFTFSNKGKVASPRTFPPSQTFPFL